MAAMPQCGATGHFFFNIASGYATSSLQACKQRALPIDPADSAQLRSR